MAQAHGHTETRRFSRITFHTPALLDLPSGRVACQLQDISLKGALVEAEGKSVKAGQTCTLVVQLDASDTVIRMDGEIAHVEGSRIGVKADEMDLDSIGHLRRLVELNLGDDALLHRELAALIEERNW
jgi:hypothetical protein